MYNYNSLNTSVSMLYRFDERNQAAPTTLMTSAANFLHRVEYSAPHPLKAGTHCLSFITLLNWSTIG